MQQQILIEELLPTESQVIQESSSDGKNTWLLGVFMQGEVKNRNGRVYPLSEIQTAVDNAKTKITETNGIFGELDHPQSLTINLDRISHVITEIAMNGNDAVGRMKILGTPMGQIAKELVGSGVALGVSSRGAGNVNESGDVSGYQFITIDLVATPSANAYPKVVFESLQQSVNGKKILSLAESVQHDKDAQKYLKKEILKWLNTGLFAKK